MNFTPYPISYNQRALALQVAEDLLKRQGQTLPVLSRARCAPMLAGLPTDFAEKAADLCGTYARQIRENPNLLVILLNGLEARLFITPPYALLDGQPVDSDHTLYSLYVELVAACPQLVEFEALERYTDGISASLPYDALPLKLQAFATSFDNVARETWFQVRYDMQARAAWEGCLIPGNAAWVHYVPSRHEHYQGKVNVFRVKKNAIVVKAAQEGIAYTRPGDELEIPRFGAKHWRFEHSLWPPQPFITGR